MDAVRTATLLGALCVWLHFYSRRAERSPKERERLIAGTVRTLGTVLWPSVFLSLLAPEDTRCLRTLAAPLLWPVFVWALDDVLLQHADSAEDEHPATIRIDPTSITAFSFGVSGLVGARADSKYIHLVLTAVVGCVAFVALSHNLRRGSDPEVVFSNVQRVVLIWCIGLVIGCVTLTRREACRLPPGIARA